MGSAPMKFSVWLPLNRVVDHTLETFGSSQVVESIESGFFQQCSGRGMSKPAAVSEVRRRRTT